MNGQNHKIQLDHLQRQAYIYVRQSTLQAVYHHQESRRRQYNLQKRAAELGLSIFARHGATDFRLNGATRKSDARETPGEKKSDEARFPPLVDKIDYSIPASFLSEP